MEPNSADTVAPMGDPAESTDPDATSAAPAGQPGAEPLAASGATDPSSPARGLPSLGESRRSLLLISLLFLLVAGALVTISEVRDSRYSLLDEVTHADWAYQAAHFRAPATGSTMAPAILGDWSCRGQVNLGKALPPCGSTLDPAKFPIAGKNYNAFHPPLYYLITGLTARAIDAVVPGFHFVAIARLLGALWLAAAMICLFLTLRYWRVPREIAVVSGLLIAAVPSLLHASRIVTNDAPAALCGVAAVFVLGRVVLHGRCGWVLPAVFCLLASATKTLNGVPLIAVGLVLGVCGLVRWRRRGRAEGLPLVRVGLGIGIAAGVVFVAWDLIQRVRALPGPVPYPRKIPQTPVYTGSPVDSWLSEVFNGFGLTRSYYLHPGTTSVTLEGWVRALTILVTASSLLLVVTYARGSAGRLLGWSLMVGCVVYVLLAEGQFFLISAGNGVFVNLTTRYGLSLITVAIAALALVVAARPAFRRFWTVFVSIGLAIVCASTMGWLLNA